MREILFRGYDTDNKCWRYSNGVTFYEIDGIGSDIYYYNIDEDSIGQYTGFEDKNGKKIFEGDILQNNNKDKYEIIWIDKLGRWEIVPLNRESIGGVYEALMYTLKIISNEYEESLKEDK